MDVDYEEIDASMREVARMLIRHGFEPTDVGQGADEDAPEVPHVAILVEPPETLIREADRLAMLLRSKGVSLESNSAVSLEASYLPAEEVAILFLAGLNDAGLAASAGMAFS